jgi:diguanylate cyclase (GGDEF)-like protein
MLKKPTILFRLRAALARHPNAIGLGSIAFAAIVLASGLTVLMQARHDATIRATENADNLARVLEHDITHTAELTDLSLQAAVDGAQDADVMQLPARLRNGILFDKSAIASQYIGSLLFLDAHGKIIVDSASAVPRSTSLADRAWFTIHRDNPHLGLFISRPLQSRINPGEVDIMFSRRVNRPDGSFAGVVVAAFRLDYFKNLLSGVNLGPGGSITLLQEDGHVILRYPNDGTLADENFTGRKNFERFKRTHETSFFGISGRDGEERLYNFRRFNTLQMIVIIAPTSHYVFADWNSRAWYIGIVTALLVLALLAAAQLLSAEFRHRLEVEAHLRNMTRVDGLTGLSNRRSLDDRLMSEWHRSRRSGKPLAILFVDIDRFKNFNDTYGHQAGDDALTAVAQAIAHSTRRPGDMAARFGGEEFVVVLPETDSDGAALIAAAIHSAVSALAIEHTESEHGLITVSIGVASTDEESVMDALALIKAADRAVYRAKASGRNQTSTAGHHGDTALTT